MFATGECLCLKQRQSGVIRDSITVPGMWLWWQWSSTYARINHISEGPVSHYQQVDKFQVHLLHIVQNNWHPLRGAMPFLNDVCACRDVFCSYISAVHEFVSCNIIVTVPGREEEGPEPSPPEPFEWSEDMWGGELDIIYCYWISMLLYTLL